jgi:hypothetical protein
MEAGGVGPVREREREREREPKGLGTKYILQRKYAWFFKVAPTPNSSLSYDCQ